MAGQPYQQPMGLTGTGGGKGGVVSRPGYSSGGGGGGFGNWLENVGARIPGVREVFGLRTDEEDALVRKQEELSRELERQRYNQQQARANMLGQQLLAFNPMNQMMAQMFGPQAAFSPEAFAQMAQNPIPSPLAGIPNGTSLTPEQVQQQRDYYANERRRREMLMGGIQQPGPGPAPIGMPTPQAARRY